MSSEAARAKNGDTILLHYVCKDEDGIIYDTTHGTPPLKIILGSHEILPAVEKALVGMAAGESKQVFVPFAEAYGPLRSELVLEIPRRNLPPHINPTVGMELKIPLKKLTRPLKTTILAVDNYSITLDANHPLAGKDLYFDIKIVEINAV